MKTTMIIPVLLLMAFSLKAQYYLKKDYIELKSGGGSSVLSITYKNLKIVPLFAGASFIAANDQIGKYRTLKEALSEGKVEILETGAAGEQGGVSARTGNANHTNPMVQQASLNNTSGNVNQLMVRNLTSDTIFIMGGELVQGGKQDRVVGENFLLPPGKDFVALPVFCVEHGRWTYQQDAKDGFKKYNEFTANSVRSQAVMSKDQSAVWLQVSTITTANKAETSTGSFNAIYNNEEFVKDMAAYKKYFIEKLSSLEGCIGFAGISGNRVVGCDLFATADLFTMQYENLLSAYITEAITEAKAPAMSDEQIQSYLLSFLTESANQDKAINEKGKAFENGGKKLHIATFK